MQPGLYVRRSRERQGTAPVAGWPAGATVTVGSLADTGYTLTFGGTHQGTDVSQVTVDESRRGDRQRGRDDEGVAGIIPPTSTATVAGFGGGTFNNTGFQVTFGGTPRDDEPAGHARAAGLHARARPAFVGETDKGGAVDNKGGTITPPGTRSRPSRAPAEYTIPLRTPFALTGSATDADADPLTYIWEQNDRGGAAGSSLLSNTKTNGPLFAMFPFPAQISETDTLLYDSPGENHVTTSPTRVFPDLQQILDNNTNADTGSCPTGPIAPPVPIAVKECFSEFLPTRTTSASPASTRARSRSTSASPRVTGRAA